jgi:hypothetical protein
MSNTKLPDHLLALFNAHPEAASIGSSIEANNFATVRYNGKKFRLIKATGEEVTVPDQHLDVIVVGINEHKSHVVYEKAYDVKAEPEAPIWSSDDGTPVPAEYATKTVSDYRRWAVLIANNPEGGVFELRVSAGSITNGDRYVTALKNFGAPIAGMITRITFDAAFDYPKLVFTPAAYIDEKQSAAVASILGSGSHQIAIAIGKKKEAIALAAPVAQAALPSPVTSQYLEEQKASSESKRGRTRKAAEVAPIPTPAPAQVFTMPTTTPAANVVTAPQPASADLDKLLANIMGS